MRLPLVLAFAVVASSASAQSGAAAQASADAAAMVRTARTLAAGTKWSYEAGTMLDGVAAHWQVTHDAEDLALIRSTVDRWVDADGHIQVGAKPFDPSLHTLDNLEPGRIVLFLAETTHDPRYAKAAATVFAQFASQPRTPSGGFWHKQVYPDQMWLDGAYMAEPFRAAYSAHLEQGRDLHDVAQQLLVMFDHMRDPRTGLLRHGWDESRKQRWADPQTGLSPESWARAMGWYMMAMADTLPSFPQNQPDRPRLVAAFRELAKTVAAQQDPATGLWRDVLAHPAEPDNFFEASASAMFVYALAKGVRLGELPPQLLTTATRGWQGVETRFVSREPDGTLTLHGTVKVSGLGGTPYRAGDYNYYVHEATGDNDLKGVGAYLLGASEIMRLNSARGPAHPQPARGVRPHGGASTTP